MRRNEETRIGYSRVSCASNMVTLLRPYIQMKKTVDNLSPTIQWYQLTLSDVK